MITSLAPFVERHSRYVMLVKVAEQSPTGLQCQVLSTSGPLKRA